MTNFNGHQIDLEEQVTIFTMGRTGKRVHYWVIHKAILQAGYDSNFTVSLFRHLKIQCLYFIFNYGVQPEKLFKIK